MSLDLHDAMLTGNQPAAGRWYGLYPATVSDNQDPDGQGRVQVRLPWAPDDSDRYDAWARVATLMAGGSRGSWFVPEVGDEVLVGFEGGSADHPFVVGALWNGRDDPPQSMDSDNNVKTLVSREDIRITLDDTAGAVQLTLSTPGGRTVTMSDGGSSLKLEDGNGNSVELAAAGITITAASKLTISAPVIQVGDGTGTVSCPMWTFSGVVKCDTLIASTVVGASYTPGAGNVW
jgi:uncharacterized protein involved in type VI secretion and phage assembly